MTNSTTLNSQTLTTEPINFTSLTSYGADPGMRELLEDAGMTSVPLADAQIIIFNGGADIGTSIYGEKPISMFIPEHPSRRDIYEMEVFDNFKDPKFLKVGICRGSQLLNCLNGGTLWQDVSDHGRSHDVIVIQTGEKIRVTSTHHQMMRPTTKAHIIAFADTAQRKVSQNDQFPSESKFEDDHMDTEIVWYPKTSTLCIQGHPEYVPGSRFAEFSIQLIREYFRKTQEVAHEEA